MGRKQDVVLYRWHQMRILQKWQVDPYIHLQRGETVVQNQAIVRLKSRQMHPSWKIDFL